jgi:nucleoid DNA-binding protein
MRKAQWGLAALIVTLAVTAEAQVPAPKKLPDLKTSVAKSAKLKVEMVEKMFTALGPAIREQLRAGKEIELPGVGTFRVVRVNAYRDLVAGMPATIPARNYVEFVPASELNTAANSPGAVPARTVEGYQFRVNPNSAPSSRTEGPKVPRGRTR